MKISQRCGPQEPEKDRAEDLEAKEEGFLGLTRVTDHSDREQQERTLSAETEGLLHALSVVQEIIMQKTVLIRSQLRWSHRIQQKKHHDQRQRRISRTHKMHPF